jgi:D-glycero-alpha-D-manno-heptose-7-phosphate kinase
MIVSKTPLRVSLLGGGTDFPDHFRVHGGAILSLAINKYIYVVVNERYHDDIVMNYSQKERVHEVGELKHDLARECLKKVGIYKAVEITTLADIPTEGSGLGSSSAVTVGILNALYAYKGEQVSTERLVAEACEIEVDILRKPIGYQDQIITAHGDMRFIAFNKDGSISLERVDIDSDQKDKIASNLLLFYTNRTRSADAILAGQKANIQSKEVELIELSKLATRARDSVQSGRFGDIGTLLNENWDLKKTLAPGISDPQIDEMYSAAISAGATGAKIAGAGGGGFLLVYCEPEFHANVRSAISGYPELLIGLSRDGSKIIFNY